MAKRAKVMNRDRIRTTVDIPAALYGKLKSQAAARGGSVRSLILAGIKAVVLKEQRPSRRRVRFPLLTSKGPKVEITNERIYEHVEFP
jgi:hypothetical protein